MSIRALKMLNLKLCLKNSNIIYILKIALILYPAIQSLYFNVVTKLIVARRVMISQQIIGVI